MNWSNKWDNKEVNKVFQDAAQFGIGISKDGQYIPIENVYTHTLTVRNSQKDYTFTAEIIGDLALDYADDGWNIYHIPTLTLFSSAVPHFVSHNNNCPCAVGLVEVGMCAGIECYEYNKQPLLNWMDKVQKNYPTSWQMLRLLTPTDYDGRAQAAKDIIKEWCLSVPVVEG